MTLDPRPPGIRGKEKEMNLSPHEAAALNNLARKAGFRGQDGQMDAGAAALALLGSAEDWRERTKACALYAALEARIAASAPKRSLGLPTCRDCGVQGTVDHRGLGISCGCSAE